MQTQSRYLFEKLETFVAFGAVGFHVQVRRSNRFLDLSTVMQWNQPLNQEATTRS